MGQPYHLEMQKPSVWGFWVRCFSMGWKKAKEKRGAAIENFTVLGAVFIFLAAFVSKHPITGEIEKWKKWGTL